MQNAYDFVGGPLNGQRKALNPSDFPLKTEGGTYQLTGGGHAVNGSPTVYTALFWPEHGAAAEAGGAPHAPIDRTVAAEVWN